MTEPREHFVSFNLPVLKKERIGSCVPLCELHLFATSCYRNGSHDLVSAMFSASVSQLNAQPFKSSATITEHKQRTCSIDISCVTTLHIFCFMSSFFPPAERRGLSAAVAGGVCGIL